MNSNSAPHSSARRPRRPGDVKHDPLAVDADTMLDDVQPAKRGGARGVPVMCQELLLLRAGADCPQCGGRTPVFAMMGLPEFEVQNAPSTLLRRIVNLPPEVDKAVRAFSKGRWRNDHRASRTSGALWLSHCARCDARLDEDFTLGDDGPFRPRLYKQRVAIKMERLPGPFVLDGAQRLPNLPMLSWLDWHNDRERKAHAAKPRDVGRPAAKNKKRR
ncbi:hypothetical protein O4H66_22820 [Comamonadaceae bacterium G21597-S1]|nr:hypothetical protein [Comamonadaceae bacterium G21597-S1]